MLKVKRGFRGIDTTCKSVMLQTMGTNPSNEQRPCVVPPTYGVTDHEISSHVNTLQRLSDNNNRPVAQIFSRPQGEPFQSNPPASNKVNNVSKVAGMFENNFSHVENSYFSHEKSMTLSRKLCSYEKIIFFI